MLKLTLLVIFFALASAEYGVINQIKTDTLATFQCFAKNNFSLVITDAWDQNTGPNYYFNKTVQAARSAGIPNHDAFIRLGDVYDPEEICRETVNVLPTDFNGTVWIDPGYDFTSLVGERMDYLDNVTKSCQQHGLKLGIYSSWQSWQETFQDRYASSSLIQALPLIYTHNDHVPSFNDFQYASFGKWTVPTMKDFYGAKWILCNRLVGELYY